MCYIYLTQDEFDSELVFSINILYYMIRFDIIRLNNAMLIQPGWPDKHLSSIGWELEENQCLWCPETGNQCPVQHRMSPVNLVRDRAIEDNPNWKDCPDWHWYVIMSFLMNRRMCSFLVLFCDDLLTLFPLLYYVIG